MNQDYLFKQIRKGVTASRQIVVTGYCTAEFMEGKKTKAVLVRNGAQTELACVYTVDNDPAFKLTYNNGITF